MSYKDFQMFEEWNKEQEVRADEAQIPKPPVFSPASWGRRVGAYLIDSLVIGIPVGIYAFSGVIAEIQTRVPELIDPVTGEQNAAAMQELTSLIIGVQLKASIAFAVLACIYYVAMHGFRGQTLGKMVVGIKVVNEDHTDIDFGTAAKRAIVFPLGSVIPTAGGLLSLLNGLWPLWDVKKQSLGDKLAKTLVVNVPDDV